MNVWIMNIMKFSWGYTWTNLNPMYFKKSQWAFNIKTFCNYLRTAIPLWHFKNSLKKLWILNQKLMINHHIIARLWEGKAQSTYQYTMKEFHPAVWENLYIYSKQGHNKGFFWTFQSWEGLLKSISYTDISIPFTIPSVQQKYSSLYKTHSFSTLK